MKIKLIFLLNLLLLSFSYAANNDASNVTNNGSVSKTIQCANGSACILVENTTNQVLNAINKNANASEIADIVTPNFDFTLMTKYALGTNWKLANSNQQDELVSLFKELLIYTYSSAIYKFKGAQIIIVNSNEGPKKAAVISQVKLPNSSSNNQNVKVEYDLVKKTSTDPWKAYDIKIENASLVTTYRNQFNDVIQSNKIPGLIKVLKNKVSQLKKSKFSNNT